ncbi:transporter [Pantoea rodasii]|uniref:Transporter n=1 Tax=Pantoea rodasii TaxID=1076549 RepID=A0A2M9W713_9GAMM|nr:AEC family transporter [Pantoea rodasii]ORM65452.1 transporter [Pantoea rodasii]PJZ03299.1 transporter [Pantoea rodasii]
MLSTFLILLPIFGLIVAGYGCRMLGVLGPTSATELNKFVVWLALPALLFDIMAHTPWHIIYQPGFFWAFALSCAAAFVIVFLFQKKVKGKSTADASVDGVAAAYPNTGYLGFPLLLLIFGKSSLIPTTTATIVVACILFAIAIAMIEIGLQSEREFHRLAIKVVRAIIKNPLIISPLLGAACSSAGLTLPDSLETFLKMLGGAASPCALVCLGVFLASRQKAKASEVPSGAKMSFTTVGLVVVAKLVLQPLLTWVLAVWLFHLPDDLTKMAILLAALPTGTGPFMLAEYYRRDAQITSAAILISTVLSIVTLVAIMHFMQVTPLA